MSEIKTVNAIYGNPGAGKSTLANCAIKKQIFESGLSASGLTKRLQEYYDPSERTLWTDTPGLADPTMRAAAAAEIETCLKKDKEYKIAFVVTVDSGRVRMQDIETINCVCDAIKTDFTFGMIINKLSSNVKAFLENSANLDVSIRLMRKRPSAIVMIPNVPMAADENNALITDSAVSQQLLGFFNGLRPSFIRKSQVDKIETRNFDQMVDDLTRQFEIKLAEIRNVSISSQEREEKFEYGPEEFIKNESEEKGAGGFKGSKMWLIAVYGKRKIRYARDKITRGSGQVEITDWKLMDKSEPIVTKKVHISTDGAPRSGVLFHDTSI